MVVKACSLQDAIKNLGITCNRQIGAAAMIAALPPDLKATLAELSDPTWWKEKLHAPQGERVYLLFGNKAPIHMLDDAEENDVTVTLDNGATFFIRYGFYNTTYSTANGSLCYAQALASLVNSGYSLLEIDKQGQTIAFDNDDETVEDAGTFSAMPYQFMYSPKPQKGDLKNKVYMNKFFTSMDPQVMLDNGTLLTGLNFLLNLNGGLIDAKIKDTGDSTQAYLQVKVLVKCTDENLVAKLLAKWEHINNFILKNVDDLSVTVAIESVSVEDGTDDEKVLRIGATMASGETYRLYSNTPLIWYSNLIIGYEGIGYVDIMIP